MQSEMRNTTCAEQEMHGLDRPGVDSAAADSNTTSASLLPLAIRQMALLLGICLCTALLNGQTLLAGNQTLEPNLDSNAVGLAEAFPVTATAGGQVGSINFFLDESSTSTKVYVGIYGDSGGKPGSLLTQGNTTQLYPGTWNSVAVTAASLTSGTAYWIAILGTTGGKPYFYDQSTTSCNSQTSSQSNLTSLPSTWSKGKSWNTCNISAYAVTGTLPSTDVIGDQVIESNLDSNPAEQAEAFPAIANTTGSISSLDLYLDPTSGAGPVYIGLYADNGHDHPGTLLGQGSTTRPVAGSVNQIAITQSSVTAGQRYWIAVLGTQATSPYFRDRQTSACHSETSSQTTLTSMPATWSTGKTWNTCYIAAYGLLGAFVPPSITALPSPAANANGWNNSTVTVSFTCTAGTYPIQSCPSPIPVSSQGADQVITGTVVDTAGNSATAKVTLNIDLTAPTVSIGSPANGAVLTSSPAAVSGSVADSLSGVASITCDGSPATLQSGAYACAVGLTAGADTISVVATDLAGNASSQSVSATLIVPATIVSFAPPSAPSGTLVTVQGSGFAQTGFPPEVTLNQEGGGTIVAPISSTNSGTLSFVLPSGAASGPITVTVDGLTTVSSSSLSVVASSTFSLSAGPTSVTLLPGQSAYAQVSLTTTNGFTQPAALSVSGLPSGVVASFQPPQITAGGSSILTLSAPGGQGASSSTLTISASATVQGIQQTQTAQVGLSVEVPSGSATFVGQVAVTSIYNTPLAGVTVSFTGKNYTGAQTGCTGSTTTDGGGNFVLTGLSSSCTGSQMIQYDPSTVSSPPGKYSGVTLSYTLTAGQVTTPGLIVHLPNVANAETFTIVQDSSSTQTFTSRSIPGITFTIYPGTTFTMPDGSQPDPFPLSIVEIPYSQVPDFMPPNPTEVPVFAMSIEPENSSSSLPIAITYPNRSNTPPGTDMPLTSLNPTLGMMVNYGTGAVSADGTQIIPDPDPANPGHLYGVTNFDWFFFLPPPPNNTNPSPDPNCPCAGDPVDFGSGLLTETNTDISFGSARGQVAVTRVYRSMASSLGPFGLGSSNNYNYFLDLTYYAGLLTVIMPDGNRFPFAEQTNGTYTNSTVPSMAGAVITIPVSGTYNLRWKDGTTYQFQALQVQFSGGNTGYLTAITDANGNTTTISRNNLAEITQIADPTGRSLSFAYGLDAQGHIGLITSITDPIGRSVSYTYNVNFGGGTIATFTDVKGGVTSYTYNSSNQLTSVTDPLGNKYQNTFDANGRVIQQTAPNGGVTQYAYTLLNSGAPTSPVSSVTVTDPRLNTTTYQFNPAGFVQSQTDAMGNQTFYNVNPATNQRVSTTDPLGRTTAYTYDANGNTTSTTFLQAMPSGEQLGSSPDVVGPTTTSYVYDPTFNKPISMTDPFGNVTTYTYDDHGNLLSVKDALGRQTSYTYDSYGEKVSSTDPLGNVTQYAYTNGTLSSVTDPLGRTSTYVSDLIGRQVSVTTPLGQTTQYRFDPLNQLASTTDAVGDRITDAYDSNENLLSVTDPLGNITKFSYDSMNRLMSRTDPLGHTQSYQRDLNGNITQFTDRRGTITAYAYDSLNRKTYVNYGPGGTVAYSYDAMNRLTQAVDSVTGSVVRSYDLLDRMISENTANGSVSYAYDAAGRRISMQVSGQAAVAYTYDADNELTHVTQSSSAATAAFDADGRRTTLTLPNGAVASYGFDAASEVTAISYQMGSANLGNLTYSYDAGGQRSAIGGNLAKINLPTAVSAGAVNANLELTQWNGTNLTYDANGNLLSDGTNTYTWDARNRLVSISGGASASFRYDPFGRRVSKTIGATTTSYLYDQSNSVQESVGGLSSANILAGIGMDQYYQRTDGSGTGSFITDALGSTVSLVAAGDTTIVQYTYDPYGNTTSTGTSANSNQYTGREDDGTGLYYYRARYYEPKIGRFISEDPAGYSAGMNLYSYVDDSPPNFADPSGQCPPPNPCAPMGKAPTPKQYRDLGWAAQASWYLDPLAGGLLNVGLMANFRRGALLDAQVLYGGSPAYANYAFGDYMAAAGIPLQLALDGASAYAAQSGATNTYLNNGVPMDPNYPNLPASNVANITQGYNDEQNGTLCTPSN